LLTPRRARAASAAPTGRYMSGAIAQDNVTTDAIVFPGTAIWGGLEVSRLAKEVVMSAFWTRGRDTNAGSEDAAAAGALARIWRLTAVDRCDRCGAQAYVRVLLPGRLELLFCAHHNRQYSSALADVAVEIQDETTRLACALYGIRVIPIPGPRIAPSELRARQLTAGPQRPTRSGAVLRTAAEPPTSTPTAVSMRIRRRGPHPVPR
jgi:hypothetical protein